MKTTLVIGDAHADPDHSLERFEALGNFIADRQPDNIVQIGDWGSYDSINFHDKSARVKEGKRLIDDLDAANEAYAKMSIPVIALNRTLQQGKKRQYKPNGYWFESNHEFRIKRYVDENPVLEGFLPETDLVGAKTDGWEIVGWKDACSIEGITFCHIPINDGNNQPVSGKYVAYKAADHSANTIVFGHTHRFGVGVVGRTLGTGARAVEAINVGWFGDYVPDYMKSHSGTASWWSGLVLLHHIEEGRVDIERISIDRIKQSYL